MKEAVNKPSSASPTENGASIPPPKVGYFDSLPLASQFFVLTFFMFLFFGAHNVLQEAMIALPGFDYAMMLGYMEVIGVACCSFFERTFIAKETGRKAPISEYTLLTLCLLGSSALSNEALNYINFPTKVVFRSCKLVPTMVIATIINKRTFSSTEYVCGVAVCAGLIMFAAADWKLTPSFNPIGIVFVSLSVVADAILPNAQEKLFRLGSSRLEVTLYTNVFALIAMTIITLLSGDLIGIIRHALADRTLMYFMIVFTAISYAAISTYMQLVKRFGGVAAVLLTTARKGMTLVLSFLLFPKKFSWYYVAGAILVLGSLLYVSIYKHHQRSKALSGISQSEAERLPLKSTDIELGSTTKAKEIS